LKTVSPVDLHLNDSDVGLIVVGQLLKKERKAMRLCLLDEMPIPVEASIKQHLDDIISGKIPEPEECCPRCFSKPETFKLHECRKRAFRYIAGNFVKIIITLLVRWKCSDCGKTFTIYPSFAAPHKRYTLNDILSLRNKLIEDDQQTCYTAVTHEGSPIGYQEENEKNVDHFLAPSTLWRWIHWSGDAKKQYK
jgi:hypothetical protein